jgi:hypothetical protein
MTIQKSLQRLSEKLKAVLEILFSAQMKRSSMSFIVAMVLAFLSLGMIGLGLFILVTPALNLLFGLNLPMDHTGVDQLTDHGLSGDAVWPTIILVSLLWPFGFLMAGFTKHKTIVSGLPNLAKNFVYLLVLWLWALCLWAFVIKVGFVN